MVKTMILASILVAALAPRALADDDGDYAYDGDGYDYDSVAATPRVSGDDIAQTADDYGTELHDAGAVYTPGSQDCSAYVTDVMNQCGIEVDRVTTGSIATDPGWTAVDPDDAAPGDAIVYDGHMGVYTGDDDDGTAQGWQMGHHGAAEIGWDDDAQYYRPLQTADFEERIGDQVDELWPSAQVGEQPCEGCATAAR